ncbi:hypothetical protein F5876DRAFT_82308 [Lentinula aff. lateritia]|uniref:Uncharacterized protein n=1 Tax=Lentinula aff. lateritia TaxID=2804960 RepID=A0ACC1TJT1_9AGAR|nr:hypothetical protein F5876DRAFT_82308 [Lentinula aff. lateritia]
MAQRVLADNRLLREGQTLPGEEDPPPEMPKTGPMELLRKRKRVVDSEEEAKGIEGKDEEQEQEEEQGEEEEEELAPKKARSSKGKERAVE